MIVMVRLLLTLYFTCLAALTTSFSYAAETRCERPLVVGYSGDWFPYFNKTGKHYGGLDYILLKRTLARLGCSLEVLPMTEVRSLIEQKKGTFDVSIGASLTTSRKQDFIFSAPYRQEKIGLLARSMQGFPTHVNLKYVVEQKKIIAINQAGYFGPKVEVAQTIFSNNFRHGFNLADRIKMLEDKKVDAVIDDYTALCLALQRLISSTNNNGPAPFFLSSEVLHESNIYYIFSKHTTSPSFVNQFNDALNAELSGHTQNQKCVP